LRIASSNSLGGPGPLREGAPSDFDAVAFARIVTVNAELVAEGSGGAVARWDTANVPRLVRVILLGALLVAAALGLYTGSQLLKTDDHSVLPTPTTEPALPPERATATLDMAGEVVDLTFAPDGTAWAATGRGVLRWDEGDRSATSMGSLTASRTPCSGGGPGWRRLGEGHVARALRRIMDLRPEAWRPEVTDWAAHVDEQGRLWVAAITSSVDNKLLRFDGDLTVIDVPESIVRPGGGWANQLSVTPTGTVFASPSDGGLAAFDGATWTRHSKGTSGLPQMLSQTAAGRDGMVWAELSASAAGSRSAGGVVWRPAGGLARSMGRHGACTRRPTAR
jgi:hypothetical protein